MIIYNLMQTTIIIITVKHRAAIMLDGVGNMRSLSFGQMSTMLFFIYF